MKITARGFLICPKCGKPTKTKVLPRTILHSFPLYCTWCKQETVIDSPDKTE